MTAKGPAPPWAHDRRARVRFERGLRNQGYDFVTRFVDRGRMLQYRVEVFVPTFDEQRQLKILIPADRLPTKAGVWIDGPECRRHRFTNGSLCMWWKKDPPEMRWKPADGLGQLVELAREHAFCEGNCQRGLGWPKPESPGDHTPEACATCLPR